MRIDRSGREALGEQPHTLRASSICSLCGSRAVCSLLPVLCSFPLTVSSQGWRRHEDLLSLVPGRSFEYRQDPLGVQTNPQNLLELKTPQAIAAATAGLLSGADGVGTGAGLDEKEKASKADKSAGSSAAAAPRKKPLTLVVFLGGVTMSEISALRFLSEREDHGRDYVVATTKLVNGGSFLESLQEVVVNKLNGGPAAPPTPQPNTPFRVPVGAEAAAQRAQAQGPKMGVLGPTPAGAGAKKK